MATTEYTITDADAGQTIGPADGFVVKLRRTKVGPLDPPAFDEGRQQWTNGRFVLRGSGDHRDLVSIDTGNGGVWASFWGSVADVLIDASVSYRGELKIVCVPKGSVWEIALSDIPYARAAVTFGEYVSKLVAARQSLSVS